MSIAGLPLLVWIAVCAAGCLYGQSDSGGEEAIPIPPANAVEAAPLNEQRILGLIPNYQTVEHPTVDTPPLTRGQKWQLFLRGSTDPFNLVTPLLGAGMSQAGNQMPRYGGGTAAFAKRYGAAIADQTSQSFFSDALLASVLHQDPRYFRKGPGSGILARAAYALTRVVVSRTDAGTPTVNLCQLLGVPMGIALSNAYYPSSSRTGTVMFSRLGTSFLGSAVSNLLPEFWPDVRKKVFHKD